MSTNTAVWMDHEQARISRLARFTVEHQSTARPEHVYHKHSSGSDDFPQHPEDTRQFFHAVVRSLDGSNEILLAGPSTAKFEFFRYLHRHDRALGAKIVGIETVERPTNGWLAAFERRYFEECERT